MTIMIALSCSAAKQLQYQFGTGYVHRIGAISGFLAGAAVSSRNSKKLLGGRAQYSTASNPKQITEFSRVHPKNGVNFPTPLTVAKRRL
ncbi:MAG: hypothetical protein OXF50_09710 [Caldilineaceae bacterium]|nr:hypothetical protein [Caldilineaceae bacterium]